MSQGTAAVSPFPQINAGVQTLAVVAGGTSVVITGCFRASSRWVRLEFREQVLCFGSVVCGPSANSQKVATLL